MHMQDNGSEWGPCLFVRRGVLSLEDYLNVQMSRYCWAVQQELEIHHKLEGLWSVFWLKYLNYLPLLLKHVCPYFNVEWYFMFVDLNNVITALGVFASMVMIRL